MAITASGLYGLTLEKQLIDTLNQSYEAETHKVLMVTDTYTHAYDTHDFRDDITNEVTGTGYTAGGVTLTGVTTTYDAATNRVKVDANDAAFGTVTLTGVTGLITYVSTGTNTTSPLMSYHSFASVSPNAVSFTYTWHADGILTFAV